MSLAITILGCGSSAGVPRVGQGWGACDPNNPKNRRRRCAIFVERTNAEGANTQVLIDMGPDLRAQLLDLGIDRLDAILLTHAHADHTHGIDEIRPLVIMHRRRIDLYMDAATSAVVRSHFGYIFETPDGSYYPPLLNDRRLTPGETVTIAGPGGEITFTPFRLSHGEIDALGFRIGDVAYTPDLNGIPVESERYLRRARSMDRRCLALYAASKPFLGRGNSGLDREIAAEARHPDQSSYRRGFRADPAQTAAACRAGL